MAKRPVFYPKTTAPYRTSTSVEFIYNKGLATSQKQKNITAVHRAYMNIHPGQKVLEISSKSMQPGGVELSAFNLKKFVPSLGKSLPVENIYQAGKVFRDVGPFTDLLEVSPREAKRDERFLCSGPLTGFSFEGQAFPLTPETAFYDYLYLNALLENEELAKTILEYDAFTDIEFNPERSTSCQAKSAAMFVSLNRLGLIDKVRDVSDFLSLYSASPAAAPTPAPVEVKEPEPEKPSLTAGSTIRHKIWGDGTVLEASSTTASVEFASVGVKKLGIAWLTANCEIL